MRKDKYFSTLVSGYGEQCNIVIKAKSLAAANKEAEKLGLFKNIFKKDFTTGLDEEIQSHKNKIEMTNKYGCIIGTDGMKGENFIDIHEMLRLRALEETE